MIPSTLTAADSTAMIGASGPPYDALILGAVAIACLLLWMGLVTSLHLSRRDPNPMGPLRGGRRPKRRRAH